MPYNANFRFAVSHLFSKNCSLCNLCGLFRQQKIEVVSDLDSAATASKINDFLATVTQKSKLGRILFLKTHCDIRLNFIHFSAGAVLVARLWRGQNK